MKDVKLIYDVFLLATLPPTADTIRVALEAAEEEWFRWLLISSGVVALGCILECGETLVSLIRWWRTKNKLPIETEHPTSWHVPAGAIGLVLVICGVIGEAVFEALVSKADTHLRAHDEQILTDALQRAGDAKASAESAATAASNAVDASKNAFNQSSLATTTAGSALVLANGARQEANSFEKEIVSATNTAVAAEQHLAEAQRQAAQAEGELERIRLLRSLSNVPELVAILKQYKGTEYTLQTFLDIESTQLTKAIDGVLAQAGWVRKEQEALTLGVSYLNIFGPEIKDAVPACIETGVQVHVHSLLDYQTMGALAISSVPKTIQAAIAFRQALAPHISPVDERNTGNKVSLDSPPGEGPVIVCIGRKP